MKTVLMKLGILFVLLFIVFGCEKNKRNPLGQNSQVETYQEKVQSVEEIEQSNPLDFLTATANFETNFWGTKLKVTGVIKNNATVATYKDAVLKIVFLTKTDTEIGSEGVVIYELLPPTSEVPFSVKVNKLPNVAKYRIDIVKAVPVGAATY